MKKNVLLLLVFAGALSLVPAKSETKTEVISTDVLRLKPTAKFLPDPVYPVDLKKKGIAGTALIGFVITAKGEVAEVKVLQASHPAFGEAAKDAVSHARFSAGIGQDGEPVTVHLQVPFKFDPKK